MSCNQPNFSVVDVPVTILGGSAWVSAEDADNRWLIVSNYPETINVAPAQARNLYRCETTIPANGKIDVRVYLWHVNNIGSFRKFWIAVGFFDSEQSGEVVNHKSIVEIGPSNPPDGFEGKGICLAKAYLAGTLDNGTPLSGDVPQGSYLGLGGYSVSNKRHVGAIHEFTIIGSPGANVSLRTVLSPDENLGTHSSSPLDEGTGNVRGSWPKSRINVYATPINITPINKDHSEFRIGQTNGKDVEQYAKRGEDYDGTAGGNKGLRGVSAYYYVELQNDNNFDKFCVARLRASNPDNKKYWGAARDLSDPNNPIKGVPKLFWNGNPPRRGVRTADNEIIQAESSRELEFRNAAGGGSSFPVNLLLEFSPTAIPADDPVE